MNPSSNYFIIEDPGCLELIGEDCFDFLQRQTTNDLTILKESGVLYTVLTTGNANILDLLTLLPEFEQSSDPHTDLNSIYILTLNGYGENTFKYLKSRIFFMDKVSISDRSKDYIQVELFEDCLDSVLNSLGFESVPEPGHAEIKIINGRIIRALGSMDKLILTCRLFYPIDLQNIVSDAIRDSGGEELSSFEYNLLRLEAGFPVETRELTEEYSPLEVGLENFISTSKGCYTGQEVIARQLNYDKVARQLCGLKLDKMVNTSDRIWSDGRTIGVVTSVGNSPRFGFIALGVLRKPYNQAGTEVLVGSEYGRSARAVCINLPFGID